MFLVNEYVYDESGSPDYSVHLSSDSLITSSYWNRSDYLVLRDYMDAHKAGLEPGITQTTHTGHRMQWNNLINLDLSRELAKLPILNIECHGIIS